jgi:hypothetical protein
MATFVLLVCLGSTLFMTGLIWFVQLVHYPLLGQVGPGSFGRYHAEHVRRIGPVVASAMIAELASAAVLIIIRPSGCPGWLAVAGLVTVLLSWISTAAVQVPLHRQLASGFDPAAHRALVRTNWARTVAWSSHGLITLAMAGLAMG